MSLIKQQVRNEFNSTHHMVSHVKEDLINSGLEYLATDFIKKLVEHIEGTDYEYTTKDGEVRTWETKEKRHQDVLKMDMEKLAWKVIAVCTVQPVATYTSLVGMLRGMFEGEPRQQAEQASECIALLCHMDLIDIKLPRDTAEGTMMVYSKIKYEGNLHEYLTNTRHILPSLIPPQKVTKNNDSGYSTFTDSLILSGKFHTKPVPLDHINRMNSVPLSLSIPAIKQEPVFKEKAGESSVEREERYTQWKQFNVECMGIYAKLIHQGNKFYLTHKYDERLRSYSHGYHVHTQGDSFRKSVIELANKEVVDGNF